MQTGTLSHLGYMYHSSRDGKLIFITRFFPLLPLTMKAYKEHGIKNLTHSRPQLYIQVKILFSVGILLLASERA